MRNQRGNISIEYLLATAIIIAIVFGVKVEDKSLWKIFQDSFQTRHDNYSKSINNLDDVDFQIKPD